MSRAWLQQGHHFWAEHQEVQGCIHVFQAGVYLVSAKGWRAKKVLGAEGSEQRSVWWWHAKTHRHALSKKSVLWIVVRHHWRAPCCQALQRCALLVEG